MRFSFHLLAVLSLASCAPLANRPSADLEFKRLSDDFMATHFAFRPLEAVGLGWHQHDGRFVIPDQPALSAEEERLKRFDAAFSAISSKGLSDSNRHELQLLQSVVAGQRWVFETQRAPYRNPMFYAGALDVSGYIKRDFKPLPDRIRDIAKILNSAPRLFAAGRQNLEKVLPKPFVETAVEVAEGTASFIEKDVTQAANTVTNQEVEAEFNQAVQRATVEIRGFVDWLKKERLAKADDSFALGRAGYISMLKAERLDLTPEQVLEAGLKELRAEQARFAAAAATIDPSKKPLDIFKEIQKDHPTAEGLIPETRKDLESIRQYLIDHHIVTIPSDVRAMVEETLPPFRAVSFASMDTPGPFERKATQAYYYVTPVETNWPPQQAEEWLTAFNYYTTDIVSIHEVYPGHYVQFLALNASPASKAEKAFNSYPFVEGWAHYTEQMMIEQGFGQPGSAQSTNREDVVRGAKYRMAQSDEALLRLCRLCVSVKLHTQGMSVDEATRFFTENCYYEEKPARQEAIRGTFDPGYLYYTLGKLMILKLRQDWHSQEGSKFSLQRFHDAFLAHGAPPLPLLREILLAQPDQHPGLL